MKLKYVLTSFLTPLAFLLIIGPCFAGWGDAVKDVGSQYADDGATAVGLPYTPSEAVAGVKEVLSISTKSATTNLSKPGGFSVPGIGFELPSSLMNLGGNTSGLLSSLQGAATNSIPGTGNVFMDAISGLAAGDYSSLLSGGEDAITRFFEKSSRETLKKLIKPIVGPGIEASGVNTYLAPLLAAQQSSGIAGPQFDATDFVTEKTMDGMFFYMALKEKDIRTTNGAGSTDLLQKLF